MYEASCADSGEMQEVNSERIEEMSGVGAGTRTMDEKLPWKGRTAS
jgi:hypothetical protein